MTQAQHKPGCGALGGYGHGVEQCDCGAQPEALRLAAWMDKAAGCQGDLAVAAELRRLHAENEQLRAQLAAQAQAVPQDALTAAMKRAVELKVFGAFSDSDTYLNNWNAMREILLAAAPAAPARKPLTDEEIREWWASENGLEDCDLGKLVDFIAVVREVEARLGVKPSP